MVVRERSTFLKENVQILYIISESHDAEVITSACFYVIWSF